MAISFGRGSAAEWTDKNPILVYGFEGLEIDTGKKKVGDGVTSWNSLPYATTSTGGGPEDGVLDAGSVINLGV